MVPKMLEMNSQTLMCKNLKHKVEAEVKDGKKTNTIPNVRKTLVLYLTDINLKSIAQQ